jgi:hypothetical protein
MKLFHTPARAALALTALLLLAACATRVPGTIQPGAPGFLLGLWHGFIFPVAWFLRLIVPEVSVYAVPNNGGWYDFGYFLGICVFGVGANRGTKVTRVVYRDRVVRRDGRESTVIDHE